MSVSFVYSIATAPMPTSATEPKPATSQPIPVWPVRHRASRVKSATRRTMFVSFVYSIATAPMPISATAPETCDLTTNTCVAGTTPCQPGELCDETDDVCVVCLLDSDCADADFCNGAKRVISQPIPVWPVPRRASRENSATRRTMFVSFVYSIATAPMPISATVPKRAISRPIPAWPVPTVPAGRTLRRDGRCLRRLRGR